MEMVVTPIEGRAFEVALTGRLDTGGVERIETRFNAAAVAADGHVLVDLSNVEFVSSMGVRMLITGAKSKRAREQRFLMLVPPGSVREMLEASAIDTLIPMFPERAEARLHLLR